MATARSHDGTQIRFDTCGSGPPVVLVLGAFNERPAGAGLAAFLADRFTMRRSSPNCRRASTTTWPRAGEATRWSAFRPARSEFRRRSCRNSATPRSGRSWSASPTFSSTRPGCWRQTRGCRRVGLPTLVLAGSASPPALIDAAATLAERLPQGAARVLPGQTHDLVPESVGPVLAEFLT